METSLVYYSGFPANVESLSTVQILRSLRGMVSNNFSTISMNVSEPKSLYHSLSHYLLEQNLIRNIKTVFSNIRVPKETKPKIK